MEAVALGLECLLERLVVDVYTPFDLVLTELLAEFHHGEKSGEKQWDERASLKQKAVGRAAVGDETCLRFTM